MGEGLLLFPRVGPVMAAPGSTHTRMHAAMERGGLAGMLVAGCWSGSAPSPARGAMYLQITAVLHASGGGPTGLALLALYNVAFILPLVLLLAATSNGRALGRLGRWNRANSLWVKTALATAVVAMSFGLLLSM